MLQDSLQNIPEELELLPKTAPKLARLFEHWFMNHGIKIALIIIGMWIFIQLAKFVGKRVIRVAEDLDVAVDVKERERRAQTLIQVFNFGVRVLVITLGCISIIKELGFDIGPVLAGAGIVGLAIGFGSQSLVKDIVSGFFLIMENQIRVGDVVRIGNVSGVVEKITLRIVVLRDQEAVVHAIPNGEIKTLSNMTYGWSRAVLDIGVGLKEDIDRVEDVLRKLATGLAQDEKFKDSILEEPIILGLNSLNDAVVVIRVVFKTMPLMQWDISREYRRRVKYEFDNQGIELKKALTVEEEGVG